MTNAKITKTGDTVTLSQTHHRTESIHQPHCGEEPCTCRYGWRFWKWGVPLQKTVTKNVNVVMSTETFEIIKNAVDSAINNNIIEMSIGIDGISVTICWLGLHQIVITDDRESFVIYGNEWEKLNND